MLGEEAAVRFTWRLPRVAGAALVAAVALSAGAVESAAAPAVAAVEQRLPGRPLYVSHRDSNDVAVLQIGVDGRLRRVGDPIPTGDGSIAIAFTPDGRTAYVVNFRANQVSTFRVGADGRLFPLGRPVAAGVQPTGLAVAPDGRTLYVTNQGSTEDGPFTVSTFAIAAAGTLRHLRSIDTGGVFPRAVAVTPDNRFVLVSHFLDDPELPDTVTTFAVQRDGTLRRFGDPVDVGQGGGGIVVSPDGRFAYVAAQTSGRVHGFRIADDGSLVRVPGSPFPAGTESQSLTISPDGRRVYVANGASDGLVWAFAVGPDGRLRQIGKPVASGQAPVGITLSPDGRFLYTSNFESHDVSGFTVSPGGRLRRNGRPTVTGGTSPASLRSVVPLPNQGPAAAFAAAVGGAGQPTRFDGAASADPDGAVARYVWDFGDGAVRDSTEATATHVYRKPGTYAVTLTVVDYEGCSTRIVYTGQTASCNGSQRARTVHRVNLSGTHT